MSGRQNNSFLLSKLPIGDGCQLLCKVAAGRTHKMTKIPASHRHSQHFHQRYFKHPSPEPAGAPGAGKGCPRGAAAGGGEHCRSLPGDLGALQPHKPSRTPLLPSGGCDPSPGGDLASWQRAARGRSAGITRRPPRAGRAAAGARNSNLARWGTKYLRTLSSS